MVLEDPLALIARLASILDALGVRYFVGGSVASSLYGTPRSTQDVDLVVDLDDDSAGRLVAALQPEFYVEESAVRDAVRRHRSFNVIDQLTLMKADVYVFAGTPWLKSEMARARDVSVELEGGESVSLRVCSPEDVILAKLAWFRDGDEIATRQYDDAVEVLKVQRGSIDLEYLGEWSRKNAVADLLARALNDAGLDAPTADS